jgi:hypothetical protein
MRRASPLVCIASFVVLAAVPSGLRAQGLPPTAQGSIVNHETGDGNCNDLVTGTFNGPTISSTGCQGKSGTYGGQQFTASGTASVTGGALGSVTAHADVDSPGAAADALVADGNGMYFRYFSFFGPEAANVSKIVFTSAVTVSRLDGPGSTADVDASIAFGTLNPDNSMNISSLFTSQGGHLNCSNNPNTPCDLTFSATVNTADLDPGVTNFFYTVSGEAKVTVSTLDPQASSDIFILDPTPEFFFQPDPNDPLSSAPLPSMFSNDPNACPPGNVCFNYNPPGTNPTVTPEPATFVLMLTGMVGLGGYVRRKRRVDAAA